MRIQEIEELIKILGVSEANIPSLSENEKETGNAIYKYISRAKRAVTKTELLSYLGWGCTESTDRKLRYLISMISFLRPIIATSDKKGYRIANEKEDLPEVYHQIYEVVSRIREMSRKLIPLCGFIQDTTA